MKKPPDPALKPLLSAASNRLHPSPFASSAPFADFLSHLLNYSTSSHHNLASSSDLPLLLPIWSRCGSCRRIMRSNEKLYFVESTSGGFPDLTLPAPVCTRPCCRVGGVFRWVLLWRQPSTTPMSELLRRSDGCISLPFMTMQWIWVHGFQVETVLVWVPCELFQFWCERDLRSPRVQIFLYCQPGVFVPLLILHLVLMFFVIGAGEVWKKYYR